jgi:tetratricopeptide (TPR) repeat protein
MARDAMQSAQAGDVATAERLLTRVAAARPGFAQAQHLLGQARLKLGRFADARAPLQSAAKLLPRDVSAQVNLAGCLSVLGEHEAALVALSRAAALKPGDAGIAHNRGHMLAKLGRSAEAERAYDEALSIDHRMMPSLVGRAELLAARGDWMGALADLDMALVSRPDDASLKLKRGEILLRQGDWLRGLADHEARLELPGERYTPELPRWQGEPLSGRLLVYPEQADIESDAAICDTLMLARGVEATFQCGATLVEWLDGPTIRRGDSLRDFAAAAPLRSLPFLLNWSPHDLPPAPPLRGKPEAAPPSDGLDTWQTHLAARLGLPMTLHLSADADWLWGPPGRRFAWYPGLTVEEADGV